MDDYWCNMLKYELVVPILKIMMIKNGCGTNMVWPKFCVRIYIFVGVFFLLAKQNLLEVQGWGNLVVPKHQDWWTNGHISKGKQAAHCVTTLFLMTSSAQKVKFLY